MAILPVAMLTMALRTAAHHCGLSFSLRPVRMTSYQSALPFLSSQGAIISGRHARPCQASEAEPRAAAGGRRRRRLGEARWWGGRRGGASGCTLG